MSVYQLKIPKPVRRQIEKLPGRYRQQVWRLLGSLTSNPRPVGAKPLREREGFYRLTLDQYRIVYSIEDDILVIEVIKVGQKHGPEFYNKIG